MKILYFSPSMSGYGAALYQQDVMDELRRQANVFFYGPGFSNYDSKDTLADVLAKCLFRPDALLLGHGWLKDDARAESVDPHPRIDFSTTDLPKAALLNKEYIQLEKKLYYLRQNHFDLVFSHHHDVEHYQQQTGIRFIFWPFGVNHRLFNNNTDGERPYTLAFSGILQNQNEGSEQSNIRLRIQQEIFRCWGDIPLLKKRAYAPFRVYWSARPRTNFTARLARLAGTHRHLSLKDYIQLQRESTIFLNTLSPVGLVSTRYFENMASGAMVLCEDAPHYSRIFGNSKNFVTFRSDLSDFHEKVSYWSEHDEERQHLTRQAYDDVMKNHTWELRIRTLLGALASQAPVPVMRHS